VTVLGEDVMVGTTRAESFVLPPKNPRLFERVDRQVLTFEWPAGATSVFVALGPRHAELDTLRRDAVEIAHQAYRNNGGWTFPQRLPNQGATVHLWAVMFDQGQETVSPLVSVDYPGLLCAWYEIQTRRNLLRQPKLRVTAWAEREAPGVQFVLVYHPDRLPLDPKDGERVRARLEDAEGAEPTLFLVPSHLGPDSTRTAWIAEVGDRRGWFRLFANFQVAHPQPVALIDPRSVETLRVR